MGRIKYNILCRRIRSFGISGGAHSGIRRIHFSVHDTVLDALEELGKLVLGRHLGHRAEGHAPAPTCVEGQAITWDLITYGASRTQVAAVWWAIQARHNVFDLEPPLCKPREFTTWKRALEHVIGRPLVLKLPIHRSVVE